MTSINQMVAAPGFVVSEARCVLVWVMGEIATLMHIAAAVFAKREPTGLSALARLMARLAILNALKDVAVVFVPSQLSCVLLPLKWKSQLQGHLPPRLPFLSRLRIARLNSQPQDL